MVKIPAAKLVTKGKDSYEPAAELACNNLLVATTLASVSLTNALVRFAAPVVGTASYLVEANVETPLPKVPELVVKASPVKVTAPPAVVAGSIK